MTQGTLANGSGSVWVVEVANTVLLELAKGPYCGGSP